MTKSKGYRLVKGYGGALRVVEKMTTLSSDAEARDWCWRRWGTDAAVRIQKDVDGVWHHVDRAVAA